VRIIWNIDIGSSTPSIGEAGVEDLVPAVLGVRLREHGELGVRGRAAELAEGVAEVRSSSSESARPHSRLARRRAEPSSTSTTTEGGAARSSKSALASSTEANTLSVIRSCSSAARAPFGGLERRGAAEQRLLRAEREDRQALDPPHASRPQLRAMSVALEAQGEIVPTRGPTTRVAAAGSGDARAGSP
jgi:hypothetical protein